MSLKVLEKLLSFTNKINRANRNVKNKWIMFILSNIYMQVRRIVQRVCKNRATKKLGILQQKH